MHWKISAHVNGGASGGSRMRRPGSEDPIGVSGNLLLFWSERRCAGGALQQGNAVTSKFVVIFSFFLSFQLITQHVVVVVNLPSQAGTNCGQLYTNVYIHSHQI